MVLGRRIRGDGKTAPAGPWLLSALALILLAVVGCGGGEETAAPPPAATTTEAASTTASTTYSTAGTTTGTGEAETLRDAPFALNLEQPVPPEFRAAYQRGAPISVVFYKRDQDDPFSPEGLEVDERVNNDLERLRPEYPTIEFFSYEITNPGYAEASEGLQTGEYGTLAAELGVGYTPFVATLAPRGEQYVIENLFQGYVPGPVLDQALFDLSAADTEGNTSDVDVVLTQLELTGTGGGLEYFTVRNRSDGTVDLQGFGLRVLDPETGDVNPDSRGVQINEAVEAGEGESVSLGRVPGVVDADGERVDGTFEGGQELELSPGDQVALLDSGGAVAHTFTV